MKTAVSLHVPVEVEGCDFSIVPLKVREIVQIHIRLISPLLPVTKLEWVK